MERVTAEERNKFTNLYHRMLAMDGQLGLEKKYPVFVELSNNEISILDMVSRNSQIILKDICLSLGLPKSTLTNTINRLERKGYLERTISKRDLRSFGLVLTQKGQEAQKQHLDFENVVFESVLETLEKKERQELNRIMEKMINGLQDEIVVLQEGNLYE